MSLLKNNIEIGIPQNQNFNQELNNIHINFLRDSIKRQYEDFYTYEEMEITENNRKTIEDLICATEDLLSNCIKDNDYKGNRDEYFINLTFIYQKMSLRFETYKLEEKQKKLDSKLNNSIKYTSKLQKNMQSIITTVVAIILTISIIPTAIAGIEHIDSNYILPFMSSIVLFGMVMIIFLYSIYQDEIKEETKQIVELVLLLTMIFWIIGFAVDIKNNKIIDNLMDAQRITIETKI